VSGRTGDRGAPALGRVTTTNGQYVLKKSTMVGSHELVKFQIWTTRINVSILGHSLFGRLPARQVFVSNSIDHTHHCTTFVFNSQMIRQNTLELDSTVANLIGKHQGGMLGSDEEYPSQSFASGIFTVCPAQSHAFLWSSWLVKLHGSG
jgi:hypothetical protein